MGCPPPHVEESSKPRASDPPGGGDERAALGIFKNRGGYDMAAGLSTARAAVRVTRQPSSPRTWRAQTKCFRMLNFLQSVSSLCLSSLLNSCLAYFTARFSVQSHVISIQFAMICQLIAQLVSRSIVSLFLLHFSLHISARVSIISRFSSSSCLTSFLPHVAAHS